MGIVSARIQVERQKGYGSITLRNPKPPTLSIRVEFDPGDHEATIAALAQEFEAACDEIRGASR